MNLLDSVFNHYIADDIYKSLHQMYMRDIFKEIKEKGKIIIRRNERFDLVGLQYFMLPVCLTYPDENNYLKYEFMYFKYACTNDKYTLYAPNSQLKLSYHPIMADHLCEGIEYFELQRFDVIGSHAVVFRIIKNENI